MIPRRLIAMVILLLIAGPAAAMVEMVVIEARGIKLTPGDVIDGDQKLTLTDGQQVSLMAADGTTTKLRGPFDKPPISPDKAPTADVKLALRMLVNSEGQRERAGVIRGTGAQVIPPDPWLVDVGSSGLRCLPAGSTITFWRAASDATLALQVAPSDRSWRAQADWGQGSDRLSLPRTVPLTRRSTYVVRLGAREVTLTLISLPNALTNDAMRAGYMMQAGCDAQAKALFAKAGLPPP
jgi:hypothetical protein